MEGEKIEQHSLRNQKVKKLGPVAMEIASKGAKIRHVFSHFLRRALPPVHIAQCVITSTTSIDGPKNVWKFRARAATYCLHI